jgi:uncharacterized protein with ParB-like and HNH nuclease domain
MGTGILPPDLKTIEQLFTADAVFTVPSYQRSYAWGSDEIEDLWEDLTGSASRSNEYFLGTIVLRHTGGASYEIIDGQQRLASLSMVFSAIRSLFRTTADTREDQIFLGFLGARGFERDAQARPKLVMNRINNDTFVENVVDSKPLDAVEKALSVKTLNESNRLLLQAYKFFLEQVAATATSKGAAGFEKYIVGLIDRLRSALKFITIPVASAEDANIFFESLNARGKELAISDLVKNRLFYEGQSSIKRAEGLWADMENDLAQRPVPEFLRHYWIAKQTDEAHTNIREKNLYRAIAAHVDGNSSQTFKLLTDLKKSARDYASISDYSLWPDDPAYGDEFEGLIKALRLFRLTQCNPLLLNSIQKFKPSDIAKLFRIVANFAFRYFIIGNQSSGNLERESAKLAKGIRDGKIKSASEVGEALLQINPDRMFRANFTQASIKPSSARMARYLLAGITNHLSSSSSPTGAERVTDPNGRGVTLEHVLPQSIGPAWASAFTTGVDPKPYVDRIGNLTLLLRKPNSEAADKSFADKRKFALDHSELAINKQFARYKKWGDTEIEQRQEELAKAALQVWKLG